MARGNMLLGQASGKVGSLVFYKVEGQQVTRSRAGCIHNPRTPAQLIQRAITATVGRAYSAGKVILGHSFQGESVPGGSMAAFRRYNFAKLRPVVLADLQQQRTPAACLGRVVAPGATYPVPWVYRMSHGELEQTLFSDSVDPSNPAILRVVLPEAATSVTTVGSWSISNGVVVGDVYTVVAFGSLAVVTSAAAADAYLSQQPAVFGWLRLTVKDGVRTSTKLFSQSTFEDLFTIQSSFGQFDSTQPLSAAVSIQDVVPGCTSGTMGVIRAQGDKRSTCELHAANAAAWGLSSSELLRVWNPQKQDGPSALPLEGGPING